MLESADMASKGSRVGLCGDGTEGSRVGVCASPWSSVGGRTSTAEVAADAKSVAEARPPGGATDRAVTAASAVDPTGAKVCWRG